jgi:transcriptional regulator with XRE-family HTH domain
MDQSQNSADFGRKINALVGLQGVSQTHIAEEGGVNKSSLSRYFRGESDIRSKQLVGVLSAIGIDLHEIVNSKIDERLGKEKPGSSLGNDLEIVLESFDDLAAQTFLETVIAKAKKVKKMDLKKQIKNLEDYHKSLLMKSRK